MRRDEIARKFDQIVDFAEIEEFIDTPVKFYSSGMYMRLAFSVAAHLEPEILLVDEVLAVGDAAFQQKCLGKMGDVAKQGRTVLFVSHNMAAIQRLCSKVILLEKGRISTVGDPASVTDVYLNQGIGISSVWERDAEPSSGAYLERICLIDHSGQAIGYISTATPLAVSIDFSLSSRYHSLQLSVGLLDYTGEQIFGSAPQDASIAPPSEPGSYHAIFYLPLEILLAKTYGIKVVLWEPGGGVLDSIDGIRFIVQEAASLSNSTPSGRAGLLALRCNWKLEERG
jgi:lipopolysaccharide transport system ATP-binding protein